MAVYTVHEPPPRRYEWDSDPERFIFVRDGFSIWALLLGPLWMLRHRMWLVLLGYIVVAVAIELALHALNVSGSVSFLVGILLGLLVGFEASTLRRFTLARRKWANVGVIVGDGLESAERRFFDSWVKTEQAPAVAAPNALRMPVAATDVIGLFPEAGARR